MAAGSSLVPVGRIAGPFGIKGWVKVSSFTDPAENVFAYAPWILSDPRGHRSTTTLALLDSKAHGKGWVAKLDGVTDRDAAEQLKGLEIFVDRGRMPEPEAGQYYWADLEGMKVEDKAGRVLGRLDHMLETGSADVMVIVEEQQGERHLIPFIMNDTVVEVDLEARCIRVDWDSME